VNVVMTSVRSHFMPDNIEGIQVGDSVYFHVTNLEQDWDVPHGFAVMGATNSELLLMPGQTRTLVWTPDRVGIFPFYCTDFCSALHQEMQGYIRVSPKGSSVALKWNSPSYKAGDADDDHKKGDDHKKDDDHKKGDDHDQRGTR
jgi:nitrous-oxide reductase